MHTLTLDNGGFRETHCGNKWVTFPKIQAEHTNRESLLLRRIIKEFLLKATWVLPKVGHVYIYIGVDTVWIVSHEAAPMGFVFVCKELYFCVKKFQSYFSQTCPYLLKRYLEFGIFSMLDLFFIFYWQLKKTWILCLFSCDNWFKTMK